MKIKPNKLFPHITVVNGDLKTLLQMDTSQGKQTGITGKKAKILTMYKRSKQSSISNIPNHNK